MSNMVYLMCSLPSLTYGQVPPVSINEFNNDAKSQLSATHYKLLELVDIQKMDESDSKRGLKSIVTLLDDVKHDLFEIRNAKVHNRQAKLERIPQKVIAGNPLEREKQIMRWQWEELDSIESGKTFTLTEVMVYKLKLQILCRMDSFHEEDGAKVLASVVNPSKNEEEN